LHDTRRKLDTCSIVDLVGHPSKENAKHKGQQCIVIGEPQNGYLRRRSKCRPRTPTNSRQLSQL
jgi:hypothetical protein